MHKNFNRISIYGYMEINNLLDLKIREYGKILEEIKKAREFGDYSENSELSSAKEEKRKIETKINMYQNMVENYTPYIIYDKNKISFGSIITLVSDNNKSKYILILSTWEAAYKNLILQNKKLIEKLNSLNICYESIEIISIFSKLGEEFRKKKVKDFINILDNVYLIKSISNINN